ncbi:MAG TPA: hypothetical protein VF017_14020 [Thermoanaerobaculia bacterium]|nr:hypothetical protein [Thermoanaerobaculia bacterium]
MSTRNRGWFSPWLALGFLLSAAAGSAQTFDSGSNGSDGALNLTTPGTVVFDPASFVPALDPDGDHVYHFTTITVGAGVTVKLTATKVNAPVFWLAQGAVAIDGVIDLDGEPGQNGVLILNNGDRRPAVPGSGGFPGGVGAMGSAYPAGVAQPGAGPGGGRVAIGSSSAGNAGHSNPGAGTYGGAAYGNAFLVPLLGGSGGAGGGPDSGGVSTRCGSGGGAGGGAILIASSLSVTVNGAVQANGGAAGTGNTVGGYGSGGGIRIVAPTFAGNGALGAGANGGAGQGRIRIEAFARNFTGSSSPSAVYASPFGLFLPTSQPSVRVVSIDGVPVPTLPDGSFTPPDLTINNSGASTVAIEARNVPLGTLVKLVLLSENAADQMVDSTPLAGTLELSTATATLAIPSGFSRGYVRATWTP